MFFQADSLKFSKEVEVGDIGSTLFLFLTMLYDCCRCLSRLFLKHDALAVLFSAGPVSIIEDFCASVLIAHRQAKGVSDDLVVASSTSIELDSGAIKIFSCLRRRVEK